MSYTPGIELVLEAYTDYWRKTPAVKRLVFKKRAGHTRLAMLKQREADVTYAIYSTLQGRRPARYRPEVGTDAGRHPVGLLRRYV